MNLLDKNSLILQIGDIKLSDTDDTFGKSIDIDGYKYNPIVNPKSNILSKNITANIAFGDYKCGVSISDGADSVILAYGANRPNSNAQSMAIGYNNRSRYFFVVETFRNIYADRIGQKPELSSRRILTCTSLWQHDEKEKLIIYCNEIYNNPTLKELNYFQNLINKIQNLEQAFSREKLDKLRKTKSQYETTKREER